METQLLRDPDRFPSPDVLKDVLGNKIYSIFESFMNAITSSAYGLTYDWNYYKDGKSWLCKVCHKKKTIFWLSVWEGYFRTGFFFTPKHLEAIAASDIAENIKEDFFKTAPVGRFLQMAININDKEQLPGVLRVVAFKKNLK